MNDDAPLVSVLLMAYQQQATIADAIRGALAQTYSPLEIVISDDASSDATWAEIERAVAGYAGPHLLVLNRNAANLGIGAHLNHLVALSHGELLVVAAGDDVSLPQRCARLVDAWRAADRKPDLIASALVDLDAAGNTHATIMPSDLASYRGAADWVARPPFVVGAAQAWTRRVFEQFGPLPPGSVAEDRLMVLRAILAGGALTLPEPLVQYRRGGLSHRRRALHARDVVARLRSNNRHALVELPQMLADAQRAGQRAAVEAALGGELERERFVHALFAARGFGERWRAVAAHRQVPLAQRARLFVYAACPVLLAPLFALKRWVARERRAA
ncbi:MAG TPA: glycosyltransferase [Burkholderiaceae bacterium]|nr:glycosyltransferase [Burkholderiaceae bacterium]